MSVPFVGLGLAWNAIGARRESDRYQETGFGSATFLRTSVSAKSQSHSLKPYFYWEVGLSYVICSSGMAKGS